METEEVKVKYQTELKWASYYFISTFSMSFIYKFFQFLIFNQNQESLDLLLVLNFLFFLYCSYKCIMEINQEKIIGFLYRIKIILNVYLIYYLLLSLIINNYSYIIPRREIEIQNTTEDISIKNSNLLKDFIDFLNKSKR
jgi:hypothetical protein